VRGQLEALVQDGLGQRERGGGALAQFGGPGLRVGDQRVCRCLAVDDAQGQGFVDIDLAAGEDQLLGLWQADAARQEVHASAVGDDAAMDVGPAEVGPFAGDDEVAGQRGVGSQAGRGAVDGGDHWLGHGVQQRLRVVHALLAVPAVEADFAGRRIHAALHAGDVAAGAEALAGAGEHQCLDGLVGGDALQRIDELGAHVVAHRVALVRAVQGDRGDRGFDLQVDQGEVHGSLLGCRGRRGQSGLMLFSLTIFLQRASSALT
jgi:hypothetical protein